MRENATSEKTVRVKKKNACQSEVMFSRQRHNKAQYRQTCTLEFLGLNLIRQSGGKEKERGEKEKKEQGGG